MSARIGALLGAGWLAGCSAANFNLPGNGAVQPAGYYAEFCALSQIKKRSGAGAEVLGGVGGHAVLWLGGACRVEGAGYPVLRVCQPGDGVGVSMNEHFRNAKWVAVPGHGFFFDGMAGGGALDQAGYERTQAEAKRLGIYDGVEFHAWVFEDMPPGWTRQDWTYEVSAATDYAVGMGRGRYCARVPATRAQMAAMVAFLNAENAPYRAGQEFRWSVLRDNCIHLAHNALAAAGFWDPAPTRQAWLPALLDMPTPRNEFVNIMQRGNAPMPTSPAALLRDKAAARSVAQFGVLPMGPGTLAYAKGPQAPNLLYRTDVALVFFGDPVIGGYQAGFDRIFADPRHTDARANAAHVAEAAATVLAAQHGTPGDALHERFYAAVARAAGL